MQKKKIFIEIQLPAQTKRRLAKRFEQWEQLPVKWSKEDNLHLTVAFVGYVDESVTPEICAKVGQAVESLESFDLELDKIEFSPNASDPKMVVLSGQPSEELRILNEAIEEALSMNKVEHKQFSPKITLGKIRKEKWTELEEKPSLEEKVHIIVPVDYVSVMESKGGGAEYISLEDCPLA